MLIASVGVARSREQTCSGCVEDLVAVLAILKVCRHQQSRRRVGRVLTGGVEFEVLLESVSTIVASLVTRALTVQRRAHLLVDIDDDVVTAARHVARNAASAMLELLVWKLCR